jgi:hypothetical protein
MVNKRKKEKKTVQGVKYERKQGDLFWRKI